MHDPPELQNWRIAELQKGKAILQFRNPAMSCPDWLFDNLLLTCYLY